MNKSKETQIALYGGIEGYRAEMRRRSKLSKRTDYSTNYLKRLKAENPEKLSKIQSARAKKK